VEISLIAQDTTSYGADLYGKPELAKLLRGLAGTPGVKWWRLMYVYPERLSRDLLLTMRDARGVCRYLDMPLQHIADGVLKKMRRASTERSIKDKLEELRALMPDIALRTNFITGFPGETEADFERLLAFVKEARFDNVAVFPYSREPGTAAASLPGQVPEKVKAERVEALIKAQSSVIDGINAGLKGKQAQVLMDSPLFGRTYRDAPEIDGRVEIDPGTGPRPKPGQLLKVKFTGASGYLRRAKVLGTKK